MSDTFSSLAAFSAELERLVATIAPSVVAVHSHRSRSSGFCWRSGLIVTASEALAEEGEITVTTAGGQPTPAALAGRDPTTDIALLRVATELAPAKLDTAAVNAGSLAIVVGSREGMPLARVGSISFGGPPWRSLRGGKIDARIELGLSLSRQAEGGIAIDAAGRGLGMAVFGPRRRVLVIPAATIERVAASLETDGRVPRGYLGLGLQAVRLEEGGVGAMVMSLDRQGPGAAAGIAQGDVIVAWNRQPIGSVHALLRGLGPDSVGTSASLSLLRGGAPTEVTLTIGERPRE